jgi:arylsulfatase A-like enzyme
VDIVTVVPGMDTVVDARAAALRRLFWAAVALAVTLAAVKAYHLGASPLNAADWLISLAAISYTDAIFAAACWACARALVGAAGGRPVLLRLLSLFFVGFSAICCLYAVVNVLIFGIFGSFLTYPLLAIIGNVRMVRSSVSAHLTRAAVLGLVSVPCGYVAAVAALHRASQSSRRPRWTSAAAALFAVWLMVGHRAFVAEFDSRQDRRIAESPHWVMAASWWQALKSSGIVRMPDRFPPDDLSDFEPTSVRHGQTGSLSSTVLRRASEAFGVRATAARRPPNVILVVLESVAARWTSLHNPTYETTPTLNTESARSHVFDSFYAHIGRSSNSLVAMLLSSYPKLDFRELTEQYPDFPGTTLAAMFRDRGYRTAFVTPSDLDWAGWREFLGRHGFDDVWDYHHLACGDLLSSWGVEDRCMFDAMVDFVAEARARPFFLAAWTTQTHNPYDTSPGVPQLDLLRERTPDDWELGRYLNILHGTDRHLGRLFDAVRRAGLEQDTLVVVTGDHGQAFGYPHETYIQGRTVYEEDVHVPLMFWFPRAYRSALRSKTVGSHVDLAPTIAELIGFPPAPDWQGRSLFDVRHPHRAYFYVAEDQFRLGVREANWKYIYSLRDGREELYDLDRDAMEQRNLAGQQPDRCARLRQRLAAWAEANRRQYERVDESAIKD